MKRILVVFFFTVLCCTAEATEINLSGARIGKAALATADFNGDGYKEIVAAGSDGMLYVISTSDGTNWSVVWSHQCNDDILISAASPPPPPYDPGVPAEDIYPIALKSTNLIEASPAVADLDNDGHLDIVVAMGGNIHKEDWNERGNGGILVYRYVSPWNFQLSGDWPQPKIDRVGNHCPKTNPVDCGLGGFGYPDGLWDGIMTTPALGDIDGDGDLEIVVAGIDRRIHAWHHTGEAVEGWPIFRYNGDALLRGGLSSPALGDIDRDGMLEIVVATTSPYWDTTLPVTPTNPDYGQGTLWVINGDSTNVPGFPVGTEQFFYSSPALGDVDSDGYLEIIIGSGEGGFGNAPVGRENIVSVFNHDGSMLSNWPQETAGLTVASPALGDIDHDGVLEIVVGCGSEGGYHICGQNGARLYAWNSDGSSVAGFPAAPPTASVVAFPGEVHSMPYTPIISDYDGDGQYEMLIVEVAAWGITIVGSDGSTQGYLATNNILQAPPIIDDIDGDGKLEVLVGGAAGDGSGMVYTWEADGAYNVDAMPWPMQRGNVFRTGALGDLTFLPPPHTPLFGIPVPFVYSLLLK